MGEAHRRMELNLMPQGAKPGQPIQINPDILKNATPKLCECGGKYFTQVIQVFTVSALVSPVGKELTVQQPVMLCRDCGELLKP